MKTVRMMKRMNSNEDYCNSNNNSYNKTSSSSRNAVTKNYSNSKRQQPSPPRNYTQQQPPGRRNSTTKNSILLGCSTVLLIWYYGISTNTNDNLDLLSELNTDDEVNSSAQQRHVTNQNLVDIHNDGLIDLERNDESLAGTLPDELQSYFAFHENACIIYNSELVLFQHVDSSPPNVLVWDCTTNNNDDELDLLYKCFGQLESILLMSSYLQRVVLFKVPNSLSSLLIPRHKVQWDYSKYVTNQQRRHEETYSPSSKSKNHSIQNLQQRYSGVPILRVDALTFMEFPMEVVHQRQKLVLNTNIYTHAMYNIWNIIFQPSDLFQLLLNDAYDYTKLVPQTEAQQKTILPYTIVQHTYDTEAAQQQHDISTEYDVFGNTNVLTSVTHALQCAEWLVDANQQQQQQQTIATPLPILFYSNIPDITIRVADVVNDKETNDSTNRVALLQQLQQRNTIVRRNVVDDTSNSKMTNLLLDLYMSIGSSNDCIVISNTIGTLAASISGTSCRAFVDKAAQQQKDEMKIPICPTSV